MSAAAEQALAAAGLDTEVRALRRRPTAPGEPPMWEVVLAAGERDLTLEWQDHGGAEGVRAWKLGPRFAASTRRGPGSWDVGEPDTPAEVLALAEAACDALARATEGPEQGAGSSNSTAGGVAALSFADPEPLPEDALERLAARLEAWMPELLEGRGDVAGLAGHEGWSLLEVRLFPRWTTVVEILLEATDERTLGLILYPTDPDRPAFRRATHWDLIYYSDDLTVAEHEGLYARDGASIERLCDALVALDPAP